jgi:hypothetical protein
MKGQNMSTEKITRGDFEIEIARIDAEFAREHEHAQSAEHRPQGVLGAAYALLRSEPVEPTRHERMRALINRKGILVAALNAMAQREIEEKTASDRAYMRAREPEVMAAFDKMDEGLRQLLESMGAFERIRAEAKARGVPPDEGCRVPAYGDLDVRDFVTAQLAKNAEVRRFYDALTTPPQPAAVATPKKSIVQKARDAFAEARSATTGEIVPG